GRDDGLVARLARAIVREVRAIRLGIAVHEHDVDALRRVGVTQARVRGPVDASDLLAVELHLFPERAAQAVQQAALDRVAQTRGVHGEAAVVRADEALREHAARLAVDLDLGDDGDDRVAAVRIRDAAAGRDRAARTWARRRPRLP